MPKDKLSESSSGDNVVSLNVRLPADVHKRLVSVALDADRSLNSQIIRILRRALDEGSAHTPDGPLKLP